MFKPEIYYKTRLIKALKIVYIIELLKLVWNDYNDNKYLKPIL